MALKDPELLAAAAVAVGAKTLMPLFAKVAKPGGHLDHKPPSSEPKPSRQQQGPHEQHVLELDDESKLLLQKAELAQLHLEAEATKKRIVEVRQHVEASSATVAQHAKLTNEAARREEERQTSIQEEAVMASAMAAEAVKLAAAQALAEAREQ